MHFSVGAGGCTVSQARAQSVRLEAAYTDASQLNGNAGGFDSASDTLRNEFLAGTPTRRTDDLARTREHVRRDLGRARAQRWVSLAGDPITFYCGFLGFTYWISKDE